MCHVHDPVHKSFSVPVYFYKITPSQSTTAALEKNDSKLHFKGSI